MASKWRFLRGEEEGEKLPEPFTDLIFQDAAGEIYLGTMDALSRFIDKTGQSIENVVAWMEAPKPYEKKD